MLRHCVITKSLLLAWIVVVHAAIISVNPGDDFLAANTGNPGDTMIFNPGNYSIQVNTQLSIRSGVTYIGKQARIDCTGTEFYCIGIAGNAVGSVFTGFVIDHGGIGANEGNLYTNVSIIGNEISNTPEAYPDLCGIYIAISNDNLVVENNFIHDMSGGGCTIYSSQGLQFNYNRFFNVRYDCLYAGSTRDNCNFNYNCGFQIGRMGLEIQYSGFSDRTPDNHQVIGNVFAHWKGGFWNSFGLSLVAGVTNLVVRDNFLQGDVITFIDGLTDNSLGDGIELAPLPKGLVVENNKIGGYFGCYIVCSDFHLEVTNNFFYGLVPNNGDYLGGEGNSTGLCTNNTGTNIVISDFSQMGDAKCPVYPSTTTGSDFPGYVTSSTSGGGSGHYIMQAPAGSSHDCWENNFTCISNLQSVNGDDGTYELTLTDVFLDGSGADTGLMLWADNGNFVRFSLYYHATGGGGLYTQIQANVYTVINGKGSAAVNGPLIAFGMYDVITVAKSGDSYAYSFNNENHTVIVGSVSFSSKVVKAGPYLTNCCDSNSAPVSANVVDFTFPGSLLDPFSRSASSSTTSFASSIESVSKPSLSGTTGKQNPTINRMNIA